MQHSRELDIFEIFEILKRNKIVVGTVGLVTGLLVFVVCSFLPSRYGYMVMVRAANIQSNVGSSTIALLTETLSSGRNTSTTSIKAEGIQYIEFRYLDRSRGFLTREPYVKKIEEERNSDLFTLTIYGPSLDEAKKFSEKVVADLATHFAPFVDRTRDEVRSQIALIQNKINTLRNEIEVSKKAVSELGFSVTASAARAQTETQLITAEIELAALKSSVAESRLYNFQLDEQHPMFLTPVFPKPFLFSAAATFVAVLSTLLILILKHEKQRSDAFHEYVNKAA